MLGLGPLFWETGKTNRVSQWFSLRKLKGGSYGEKNEFYCSEDNGDEFMMTPVSGYLVSDLYCLDM